MDKKEVGEISPGLYEIYWISGGKSLAAVGITGDGRRWVAPTNWVSVSSDISKYDTWRMIKSVKKINT